MHHILFVDDEEEMLEISKIYLEENGEFTVDTLNSAEKALEKLQTTRYDAIIADYLMPDMDALTFLTILRESGDLTPFILFTGKGREEIVIEAFEKGADFYLQKGDSPQLGFIRLSNKIHHLIGVRKAEKELRESEERFRTIFESFEDLYYQTDNNGIITTLSPSVYRISGWKPEELLGLPSSMFYANPDCRQELVKKIVLSGHVKNFELLLKKKDGTVVTASLSGTLIRNPDGTPGGIAGSLRDISEQKKIEAELQDKNQELQKTVAQLSEEKNLHAASEKRFKTFFEQNSVGFAITSPEGRILHINQKLCEITGYLPDELTGKSWVELTPKYGNQQEINFFLKAQTSGRDDCELIKQYERKDGSVIDVLVSNRAVRDSIGNITSFSAIIQDISHLKQTEEELRKTNAYLENLITSANVPIIVWDSEFRITRVNRACELLIGRPAHDICGKLLKSLFPPDEEERLMRLIKTTLSGVRWETVEFNIIHQDGTVRSVIWNSSTIFSPDGEKPIATIAQGQDITEQKRLEKENEQALIQIKQNFAQLAILNDGIRNPLMVIMGYADMLGSPDVAMKIRTQIQEIDSVVDRIDNRWMESDKILGFLQKNHNITFDNPDDITGSKIQKLQTKPGCERLSEEFQAELFTILDSIDAFVYVADILTNDLLYVNKRGRTLFGDIIGQKCYQTIHNETNPCSFCTNNQLLNPGRDSDIYLWEYEDTINGRWYDCRDRLIRWTDGRKVRLEIATDITERKKSEHNLKESEKRLQTLIESVMDPVLIFGFDGTLLFINTAGLKIMDIPPSENISAFNIEEYLSPEMMKRVFADLDAIRVTNGPLTAEYEIITREKNVKTVEAIGRKISWYEKDCDLITLRDITERIKTEKALIYHIGLENIIAQISTDFININVESIDTGINEALKKIGEFCAVDRTYIFQKDDKGEKISNTHEWCSSEITPQIINLQNIQMSDFSWWENELIKHDRIVIQSLTDIPTEATNIRDFLAMQSIKSLFAIPLRIKDKFIGFIGFDSVQREHQWSSVTINLVKLVADIIANTLERKHTEVTLRESEERFRTITEYSNNAICIVNTEGRIIWVNKKMVELGGFCEEELYAANSFSDFLTPESQTFSKENFQNFVSFKPYEHHYFFSIIRKDGTKRLCEKYMNDVVHKGKGRRLIISILDVTDRMQTETPV